MKRIDSMRSYALISALGIALASALALILSPSGQADDHWDPPHQAFVIQATTPQGIPQASGSPVKVSGTITVLGELAHKDDDSCGDDDHPCKLLGLLDLLKAEGVAIHASFPDQTQDVTAAVSLQQVGTNQIQFSYTSNNLNRDDLNVFALQVTHVDEDLAELLKVQSKIDRRAATLSDLIKQLTSQGVAASDLAELVALRDRLLAISARIAQFLAQKPQLMAETDLPIQVDNIVGRGGLDSSLQHRFRAEIRADLGTAIQGEKTVIHAKITRLGIPEEPGDDDAEDQFTAAFYWQGKLLKQLAPQSIPEGSGVSFDFQTAKLLPTDLNDFEAKLTKAQTEEDDDEPVRPVADLTYHLPVAVDNTPPMVLSGATPDASHTCVAIMQPVSMTIHDAFGLVDPASVEATLKGTLNDGTLVGGDVTGLLVFASPDHGQTYTIHDNGSLNPAKEGVYTFMSSSTDQAGNATVPNPYQQKFRINRTPPAIHSGTQLGYLFQGIYYTNQQQYSLPITIVDYFDLCTVSTVVTNNGKAVDQSGSSNFDSHFNLVDGLNQIVLSSTNQAGNSSASTLAPTVLDRTPPVLSQLIPKNGSSLMGFSIAVSGSSNKPLRSASVGAQALSLSTDRLSFSGIVTSALPGVNALTISAIDLAGNSTSVQTSVTLPNSTIGPIAPKGFVLPPTPTVSNAGLQVKAFTTGTLPIGFTQIILDILRVNLVDDRGNVVQVSTQPVMIALGSATTVNRATLVSATAPPGNYTQLQLFLGTDALVFDSLGSSSPLALAGNVAPLAIPVQWNLVAGEITNAQIQIPISQMIASSPGGGIVANLLVEPGLPSIFTPDQYKLIFDDLGLIGDMMISSADVIVQALVVRKSFSNVIAHQILPLITTSIQLRNESQMKGAAPPLISLVVPGGRIGNASVVVSHQPTFDIAEDTILFLRSTTRGFSILEGTRGKLTY